MSGIIAKKLQMTQIASGDSMVPVTLLHVPKQGIYHVKSKDKDGYDSVVIQVQSDDGKKTTLLKEMYFSEEDQTKATTASVVEVTEESAPEETSEDENKEDQEAETNTPKELTFEKGLEITASLLSDVSEVQLSSVSKGKGFTGAMKRWNFK